MTKKTKATKQAETWQQQLELTLAGFKPRRVDLGDPSYRKILVQAIARDLQEWKKQQKLRRR